MSALSEKVVAASKPYLGPVAEVFLNKHAKNYMKAELGALVSAQLKEFSVHVQKEATKVMSPERAAELGQKLLNL